MSRQFEEALDAFRTEFPDVCLAYWERYEADEYCFDDEGEERDLTDSEWESVRNALEDTVYSVVSDTDALSTTIYAATAQGGAE